MAVFASSNFNGTEDDLLPTYDANWVSQTGTSGTMEIASNRARMTNGTAAAYYYNTAPASADYSASVEVYTAAATGANVAIGPVVRASTSANTSYHARYNAAVGTIQLFRFVGGTATSMGSATRTVPAVGASATLTLSVVGDLLEVTWDGEGTPLISVNNTAITAAGYPGIRGSGAGSTDTAGLHIDNFSADEAGGGAVTHTGTGALTGAGSNLAGSASRIDGGTTHTATGVLVGAGSTVAGSASRTRVFSSVGVLQGAGALLSGSADRTGAPTVHAASGVLLAAGSALAGSAQRLALHGSSGVLAGAGPALAGSASRAAAAVTHDASGALVGRGSLLNGTAQVGDVVIDTHDGFWAKEWKRIRDREKRKHNEEVQERVEEIQDEIAEVEQQIAEVKQAPKPKKATPARDFYAEQARIVEHLIARRNQLIDEEDEELLLLL